MEKNKPQEAAKVAMPRLRGAEATAALLHSALELGEKVGFDALTIEGIAERTGVAKTTIHHDGRMSRPS